MKVNRDYHVEIERHYYSVPYRLVRESVEARVSAQAIELFLHGQRVAAHVRSHVPYRRTTDLQHRPHSHAAWLGEQMLNEPTLEKLYAMRLAAMAAVATT